MARFPGEKRRPADLAKAMECINVWGLTRSPLEGVYSDELIAAVKAFRWTDQHTRYLADCRHSQMYCMHLASVVIDEADFPFEYRVQILESYLARPSAAFMKSENSAGIQASILLMMNYFTKSPNMALANRVYAIVSHFMMRNLLINLLAQKKQQTCANLFMLMGVSERPGCEQIVQQATKPFRYDAYVYVVCLSEGLLRLKDPTHRFLRICQQLPIELIMRITVGELVRSKHFNIAFVTYMRRF